MTSKTILVLMVVIAAVAAIPAQPAAGPGQVNWPAPGGANPWIPPWLIASPWLPQWTPCTAIGSTCIDCSTKLVCTKIGGVQRSCTDPTMPYCNLGQCSAVASTECAPVQPVQPAKITPL